ncbi:hypothetical protein GCM10019059_36050 [Camelimonas fluminis]|uniref:Uncharacterized protein n=1 Tax=Camelimonas fluminis TaxID=1576911 RepID=A0ABV7UHH7_9HYPH|nr:hypothetical protein [Camelimonas fluminis]GHE73256.1 hypothetical protein GCM10019059_36050 [Camelimonas fluminis]
MSITHSEILEILFAEKLTPNDWPGPIFQAGTIYPSVEELRKACVNGEPPRPPWVFATRPARYALDAASLVQHIFPDGIPDPDRIPDETAEALSNLIKAVDRLVSTPGMERLVPDRERIIVLDEETFKQLILETVSN